MQNTIIILVYLILAVFTAYVVNKRSKFNDQHFLFIASMLWFIYWPIKLIRHKKINHIILYIIAGIIAIIILPLAINIMVFISKVIIFLLVWLILALILSAIKRW